MGILLEKSCKLYQGPYGDYERKIQLEINPNSETGGTEEITPSIQGRATEYDRDSIYSQSS
jgi:hypothetical protein